MNTTIRRFVITGQRLQGTDGIRGVVDLRDLSYDEALQEFIRRNRLTPAFVEANCRAFIRMCRRANLCKRGESICFADDGRDFLQDKALRTAALRGFAEEGLKVKDLGVAPTPAAVIYASHMQIRLTAVLTASHNPAGQNGLKFFVDGFKLLPEGDVSDAELTREIFKLCQPDDAVAIHHTPSQKMSIRRRAGGEDTIRTGRRIFLESVTAILPYVDWKRAPVEIIFDPANGAGTNFGIALFEHLQVPYVAVNAHPDGLNINRNGGVAELEGVSHIEGGHVATDEMPYLPVIKAMFERGRRNGRLRWTVGMVLDGDADRGYLLVYRPEDDTVHVVAGDALAFILASIDKYRGVLQLGSLFVTTVEGDLMAPAAANQRLQLKLKITCVGDKWLTQPAREGIPIAVAAEDSGHVIKMLPVSNFKGGMQYALTGNGILTVINVIAGVLAGDFPQADVIQPYPLGFKESAYTYHVDKSQFYAGSRAWKSNQETLVKLFRIAVRKQPKLRKSRLTFRQYEFPQDPAMLFYGIEDPERRMLASIFIRPSGTENKISINIRGRRQYQTLMQAMLRVIHASHQLELKDSRLRETVLERRIAGLLKQFGPLAADTLRERLNRRVKEPASPVEFEAIVSALRREGRVTAGATVALAAPPPILTGPKLNRTQSAASVRMRPAKRS
ncbi:MAG TPA: hypothetical protein VL860_06965 [Planctomycetota bacterium]|nr:hypothetical protein [Planctomycetota bacterium]